MLRATTIQERLWELRKDKVLNLEELAQQPAFQSQPSPAMKPTTIRKSTTAILSRWPTSMRYLLITCSAGQKTGSR